MKAIKFKTLIDIKTKEYVGITNGLVLTGLSTPILFEEDATLEEFVKYLKTYTGNDIDSFKENYAMIDMTVLYDPKQIPEPKKSTDK